MTNINVVPLWVIFLGSLTILIGIFEVGRYFGARVVTRRVDDAAATLEGAALGLLALMIGFTFAMARSRFDARRDAVLTEANAIGTTALRARLLPEAESTESLKILAEYTKIRLDIIHLDEPSAIAMLRSTIHQSNQLQERLWQLTKVLASSDSRMVAVGLFIQALNDMIDSQAKRLAAIRNQMPGVVLLGLYGVAIMSIGLTGYGRGVRSRRLRAPIYTVILTVVSVLVLIQDLDRTGSGFIRVSQQPMIDTAATLATYLR